MDGDDQSTKRTGVPPLPGGAVVRHAEEADDLEELRAIEVRAGQLFVDVGMPDVAAHDPPSAVLLQEYVDGGRAWVATVDDRLAGYAIADRVDGCAHLEQVSVDTPFGRQGLGRALIDAVDRWAAAQGLPAMTLSTFRQVPWNGPYYARLGFTEIAEEDLTPGLLGLREAEEHHGLDVRARIFMRRPVATPVDSAKQTDDRSGA